VKAPTPPVAVRCAAMILEAAISTEPPFAFRDRLVAGGRLA
jgi:hypothetical protein